MRKSNKEKKAELKNQAEKSDPKAIHTSMQPFHFNMDFFNSLQNYHIKNTEFITKRFEENLKTASTLLSSTGPSSFFKEANHWWQTMGTDYLSHIANGLELTQEVKNEIEELVETEAAIAKAKPQEMFDNSPV